MPNRYNTPIASDFINTYVPLPLEAIKFNVTTAQNTYNQMAALPDEGINSILATDYIPGSTAGKYVEERASELSEFADSIANEDFANPLVAKKIRQKVAEYTGDSKLNNIATSTQRYKEGQQLIQDQMKSGKYSEANAYQWNKAVQSYLNDPHSVYKILDQPNIMASIDRQELAKYFDDIKDQEHNWYSSYDRPGQPATREEIAAGRVMKMTSKGVGPGQIKDRINKILERGDLLSTPIGQQLRNEYLMSAERQGIDPTSQGFQQYLGQTLSTYGEEFIRQSNDVDFSAIQAATARQKDSNYLPVFTYNADNGVLVEGGSRDLEFTEDGQVAPDQSSFMSTFYKQLDKLSAERKGDKGFLTHFNAFMETIGKAAAFNLDKTMSDYQAKRTANLVTLAKINGTTPQQVNNIISNPDQPYHEQINAYTDPQQVKDITSVFFNPQLGPGLINKANIVDASGNELSWDQLKKAEGIDDEDFFSGEYDKQDNNILVYGEHHGSSVTPFGYQVRINDNDYTLDFSDPIETSIRSKMASAKNNNSVPQLSFEEKLYLQNVDKFKQNKAYKGGIVPYEYNGQKGFLYRRTSDGKVDFMNEQEFKNKLTQ